MRRKICIVTGSRAEYGLLRWTMQGIRDEPDMELQVVATGMHLSPEFGLTYREIEADGFEVNAKVEMLLSADTPSGLTKAIGLGLIGFADTLKMLAPDIVLVLGDRFEILAAATAALVARTPIAHIHGGETTQGAFDEAFRHSITKMAHWHFVATEEYRKRVIQLGEDPNRVFLVGAPGIENIYRLKLLSRAELEKELKFMFCKRNLLITFHPVTLENSTESEQVHELLAALDALDDTGLIFTMPNADTGGRKIMALIDNFVASHPNSCAFSSLGQLRYLSCLRHVDGVVGNSSSGLIEAPSCEIGTINIGDRQLGRVKADSVIDCLPERASIARAIDILYTSEFQKLVKNTQNPYGDGFASKRIIQVLSTLPRNDVLKKAFYDIAFDIPC